jgi:hypothetical protein
MIRLDEFIGQMNRVADVIAGYSEIIMLRAPTVPLKKKCE